MSADGAWLAEAEQVMVEERPLPNSPQGLQTGCEELLALLAAAS